MTKALPDFKVRSAEHQARLSREETERIFESGRAWHLAPLLQHGGSVVFPHATLSVCGHQIAAAVEASIDSGARRVIALGVIHALSDELRAARARVAAGGSPLEEPTRGIQGPGLSHGNDWQGEFSLDHFRFFWGLAAARRSGPIPELILRYPFLAAGDPESLPGLDRLRELARDAVVVATMDPFHHGIGYGDPPESAFLPDGRGLERVRQSVSRGLEILRRARYEKFERHCNEAKSDGRDTLAVLRVLRGPMRPRILDLVADDMTGPYAAPPPSWVAGALIALTPDS